MPPKVQAHPGSPLPAQAGGAWRWAVAVSWPISRACPLIPRGACLLGVRCGKLARALQSATARHKLRDGRCVTLFAEAALDDLCHLQPVTPGRSEWVGVREGEERGSGERGRGGRVGSATGVIGLRELFGGEERRSRREALLHVRKRGLAKRSNASSAVEYVVNQLVCNAEVAAVALQSELHTRRMPA